MRARLIVLAGGLIACSLVHSAASVWTSHGPDGGAVNVFADQPGALLAGTPGGVYRSVDGGSSWSVVGEIPDPAIVRALAVDPSDSAHLLAGVDQQGIYETRDSGAHWRLVQASFSPGIAFYSIVFHPATPEFVLAVERTPSTEGLLWRSADGGATWALATVIPDNNGHDVYSALALPAVPRTFVAPAYGFFFQSSDGGASWTKLPGFDFDLYLDGGLRYFVLDPFDSDWVHWATAPESDFIGHNGRFRLSADEHVTWACGCRFLDMIADASSAGALWSVQMPPPGVPFPPGYYAFRSATGGAAWTLLSQLPDPGAGDLHIHLDAHQSGRLYLGTQDLSVLRSDDGGESWTSHRSGLANARIADVDINPANTQEILAARPRLGPALSTDGGLSWTDASVGMAQTDAIALARAPATPEHVYAGTSDGLYRSEDGGRHWEAVAVEMPDGDGGTPLSPIFSNIAFFGTSDQEMLAAQPGYLYKSGDGGQTWTLVLGGTTTIQHFHRAPASTRIYVKSSNRLYAVDDFSSAPRVIQGSFGEPTPSSLAVDPRDDAHVIAFVSDSDDRRILETRDAGVTWSVAGQQSWPSDNNVQLAAFDPCRPESLLLVQKFIGIRRSDDGGLTTHAEGGVSAAPGQFTFADLDLACVSGHLSAALASHTRGVYVRDFDAFDRLFADDFDG